MNAKNALFSAIVCAALVAVAAGALETPGKITGMAITSSSQASSINYCNADWACYGPDHRGFRHADCSWESVAACGSNSTCPAGTVLVSACNTTCSGDGVCNSCTPVCALPTPTPAPFESREFCGATAPAECAGSAVYEKKSLAKTASSALECKKTTDAGFGLFSCPKCPSGTSLDKCADMFLGIIWRSRCAETYSTACGAAVPCRGGFDAAETACEMQIVETSRCCKKQVQQ